MCADIANFYLNNPMDRYEHMKLPLAIIPEKITQQYSPRNLVYKVFYIWKSKRGCMEYPKQEKYQIINLS